MKTRLKNTEHAHTITLDFKRKEQISSEITDSHFTLCGTQGAGKTTLANEFDVFFVFTEPGRGECTAPGEECYNWEKFESIVSQLVMYRRQAPKYICFDTIGKLYDQCVEFTKSKLNKGMFDEMGWSYSIVKAIFFQALNTLLNAGYKFISIAHVYDREVKEKGLPPYHKMDLVAGNQAIDYFTGISDFIILITQDAVNKGNRLLHVRQSPACNLERVRTRLMSNFRFTNGEEITYFKGGKSAKETFNILKKAFNNEIIKPEPKKISLTRKVN